MCMHIFDPLDSGEQWIENWKYRYTDASLARSKLYRSRGPKWHNDRDVRVSSTEDCQQNWSPAFLILCETSNNPRAEFDAMCLAPDAMFYPLQEIPSVGHITHVQHILFLWKMCWDPKKRYVNYPKKGITQKISVIWKKNWEGTLRTTSHIRPSSNCSLGVTCRFSKTHKSTAGKHVLIEAKNFTKHQKFQPFKMSYDEKE